MLFTEKDYFQWFCVIWVVALTGKVADYTGFAFFQVFICNNPRLASFRISGSLPLCFATIVYLALLGREETLRPCRGFFGLIVFRNSFFAFFCVTMIGILTSITTKKMASVQYFKFFRTLRIFTD